MIMSELPNLTVVDHPLIRHKLALLRSVDTPTKLFRELVEEIAMLMAYEVTRTLEEEEVEVVTPLETMTGHRIAGKKLVVVPVLRAGLGMVDQSAIASRLSPFPPSSGCDIVTLWCGRWAAQ